MSRPLSFPPSLLVQNSRFWDRRICHEYGKIDGTDNTDSFEFAACGVRLTAALAALHIIPLAERKDSARDAPQAASGLWSFYDTGNGMSFKARLHAAFDSHLWCMDEGGIFHQSDAERDEAKIREYGF